jgi:hypothetical protein
MEKGSSRATILKIMQNLTATLSNTCTRASRVLVSEDAYSRGGWHWHYEVGRGVHGMATLEL